MSGTAGPYSLNRRLGGGGFGEVWLTRAPDGAELACKVSRLRRTDPNGFRFLREIRYQSQLLHTGIMPVLDYDLEAEFPWFLMPLARASLSQESTSLSLDQKIQAMSRVCEALSYAHKNGKIHRDLKPDNILRFDSSEDSWVIADFGLGRAANEETSHRTATNVAGGSRGYAAPEQHINFKDADERADIFACGQILNYLLSGDTVPAGSSPSAATGNFAYIVRRSTAYSVQERYQHIDDFYADLQLLAHGGGDLRTPERQALSILNQAARDSAAQEAAVDLLRLLYVNQSDQRLYLNVVPRTQAPVLGVMFDHHPEMTTEILRKYMSYLDAPLPVDYAEMAGRFLEDVHQLARSTEARAEIATTIVRLAVSTNTFVLQALCIRILVGMSEAADLAAFIGMYHPESDAREWAAQNLATTGLPPALGRALMGVA